MNLDEFTKEYYEYFGSMHMTEHEINELLRKNISRNGTNKELVIIMEELAELSQQVSKVFRDQHDPMHLLEEVADVYICLEELMMIAGIDYDALSAAVAVKLNRIEKRCSGVEDARDYSGLLDD